MKLVREDVILNAKKNEKDREELNKILNTGYILIKNEKDVLTFIKLKSLAKTHGFDHINDTPYKFIPSISGKNSSLLVIFNCIAATPLHMFHRSIPESISKDIALLRIVDIGGLQGSFYFNCSTKKDTEENIQLIIKRVSKENGIGNVIAYGGSKGGTAALYHGLLGGYNVVSEDPLLSDDQFHSGRVLARLSKNVRFDDRFVEVLKKREKSVVVITSRRSPEYKSIMSILSPHEKDITIIDFDNDSIVDHPSVCRNTIPIMMRAINTYNGGGKIEKGYHTVESVKDPLLNRIFK